jgi:hypothetical protein
MYGMRPLEAPPGTPPVSHRDRAGESGRARSISATLPRGERRVRCRVRARSAFDRYFFSGACDAFALILSRRFRDEPLSAPVFSTETLPDSVQPTAPQAAANSAYRKRPRRVIGERTWFDIILLGEVCSMLPNGRTGGNMTRVRPWGGDGRVRGVNGRGLPQGRAHHNFIVTAREDGTGKNVHRII